MKKTNLDYCLRRITYDSENMTLADWKTYTQDHFDNLHFRKLFLQCPNVPPELISDFCKKYAIIGDFNILALQNPNLPIDIKTKFIVPNLNGYDILKYINDTDKKGIQADPELVDFLIECEVYQDDIRAELYRLINVDSKFFPDIESQNYQNLPPYSHETQILSKIISNNNIPPSIKTNAFIDGCDINTLSNPPKEIAPQILDLCLSTLTDDNSSNDITNCDTMVNIINKLFKTGKINDNESISKIINTYMTNKGKIPETIFIEAINRSKDKELLQKLSVSHFSYKPLLFAIVNNPEYDRTYLSPTIMSYVRTLDFIKTPDVLKNTLNDLKFLIKNSRLSDEDYEFILNSNKGRLVDFIAESYFTPTHILKQIVDKFPNDQKYELLYNLNKNKECFLPSIYATAINFILTTTHTYPHIITDKLLFHAKIDFENFRDEIHHNNSYNVDLTFNTELDMTLHDAYYFEKTIKALGVLTESTHSLEYKRKLSLIKHYFENSKEIETFCKDGPVSEYIKYNEEKDKFVIDFKTLFDKEELLEKQLQQLNLRQVCFFQGIISNTTYDFNELETKMLGKYADSISLTCSHIAEIKEKAIKFEKNTTAHNQPDIDIEH